MADAAAVDVVGSGLGCDHVVGDHVERGVLELIDLVGRFVVGCQLVGGVVVRGQLVGRVMERRDLECSVLVGLRLG